MSDWENFRAAFSYPVPKRVVVVGRERPAAQYGFAPSDQLRRTFPYLMELLSLARITPIETKDGSDRLFGWDRAIGGTCGWLSPAPSVGRSPKTELHPDHQQLLECFGGVVELWNPPEPTLLLNLVSALTEQGSEVRSDDWHVHYLERCDEEGLIPTVTTPDDYVAFAVEANGNLTLGHRETGELLFFATDPGFHVSILPGAPEYTLYRIPGCPTFVTWVERTATEWLDWIGATTGR